VSRLEEEMREVKGTVSRFRAAVADIRHTVTRIEATLAATLPHLATKAEVTEVLKTLPHLATKAEMAEMLKTRPNLATQAERADKPGKAYLATLRTVLITAYAACLAALTILK
jgi:hypothetical protein